MDNRLIFAVLLVTLCWFSMGTDAQNTTTADPGSNSTMPNTGNTTTADPASNTTMPSTGNTTTADPGSNTTMANTGNTTTADPGSNTTMANTGNTTTADPASNTTMANATTGPISTATNGTTANPTTSGTPPLTPNVTVEALQANLSRAGCGTTQLCASEPASCDPSTSNCFFFSARQQAGNNFDIKLSGESSGYIAAMLSTDGTLGGNDTTYVCANNNSVVQFIPALLNNDVLTSVSESDSLVNSVRGQVIGNIIQCTFAATVPSSTTRSTNLLLGVASGSFDSSTGKLGPPQIRLQSSSVDLTNNNVSNVNNEISGSMSNTLTFRQSLTQVLLVVAGMMGLALL